MPNFGLWEWISIVILSGAPTLILVYLAIKALPGVIREIRMVWHTADPKDNHRDR